MSTRTPPKVPGDQGSVRGSVRSAHDEPELEVRRVGSGTKNGSFESLTAEHLFDETKTAKENKSLLMSHEVRTRETRRAA